MQDLIFFFSPPPPPLSFCSTFPWSGGREGIDLELVGRRMEGGKIKKNIHQSISIGKEIIKQSIGNSNYKQNIIQVLTDTQFSLIQYNPTIGMEERLKFLNQLATSVNFCFIQDDSLNSSIIIGGNNLVIDITNFSNYQQLGVKISFATTTINPFLSRLAEQKILYLMKGNLFKDLRLIFQFLKILDEGSSIGSVYLNNFGLINNLPFLHDLNLVVLIEGSCWNIIGIFDIEGFSFARIYYYSSLESLYLAGIYPVERIKNEPMLAVDCVSKWKSLFYFVNISWSDNNEVVFSFFPPIRIDLSLIEKYPITNPQYNSSFQLEKCTIDALEIGLSFIASVKLCLICAELDAKNEGCRIENQLSLPIDESLLLISVDSTDTIKVSFAGEVNERASKMATKSRNLQLTKMIIANELN